MKIILFTVLFLSACTHSIHNVGVSGFDSHLDIQKGKLVEAVGEQFVIFHMTMNTDYVDQAYAAIQQACPQGALEGLLTQHSTSHGFFSWTNRVVIKGYCI